MKRLRVAYERLGLLAFLGSFALLAGLVLQRATRLPASYTWLDPLRALREICAADHFPIAVLVTYALGAWAWRGSWDVEAIARAIAVPRGLSSVLRGALWPLCCIALVLLADAGFLHSHRDLLDWGALVVIGVCVAHYRPSRAQLGQDLAYVALGIAVFQVVCFAFTVSKALTFVPGRHYDAAIVELETKLFGVAPHRLLGPWVARHPSLLGWLDFAYIHLLEHMTLCTVLLIALRKRALRTEYLSALALCYLLGGAAYHVLPALGPSYFEPSYFPFLEQHWLFSAALRRALKINTDRVLDGSAHQLRTWAYVAAMPSLHAGQELIMLYYARSSPLAFALSVAFVALTLFSVVALGWHYPLDVLAGALLALIAIQIAHRQRKWLLPAALSSPSDLEPPAPRPIALPLFRAYLNARKTRAAERR